MKNVNLETSEPFEKGNTFMIFEFYEHNYSNPLPYEN